MRHTVNHNFFALSSITYTILLLSSFIPLFGATSVISSVHIITPFPVATIAVSDENPVIMGVRNIDPFFIPGEMANAYYSTSSSNGGVLSYTLHGNANEMNLVAKSDCDNLTVELTSLTNPTKHTVVNISDQKKILFTHVDNSFDSYNIDYFLHDLEPVRDHIYVEFELTPQEYE
jgi:hypothetical protein